MRIRPNWPRLHTAHRSQNVNQYTNRSNRNVHLCVNGLEESVHRYAVQPNETFANTPPNGTTCHSSGTMGQSSDWSQSSPIDHNVRCYHYKNCRSDYVSHHHNPNVLMNVYRQQKQPRKYQRPEKASQPGYRPQQFQTGPKKQFVQPNAQSQTEWSHQNARRHQKQVHARCILRTVCFPSSTALMNR